MTLDRRNSIIVYVTCIHVEYNIINIIENNAIYLLMHMHEHTLVINAK